MWWWGPSNAGALGNAIRVCLSSTSFLFYWSKLECILLGFFWYVLVSSLCAFLSFCTLVFVGFLLFHKYAVFTLSRFFLTASVSYGTLHLSLVLLCMHFVAATSIWVLTKLLYLSFGVSLKISLEEYRISFLQLPYIYG